MRKVLEIGGIVAAAVLIAFGIAAIVMAADGRSTVSANLKTQQITGTPDMASNSKAIAGEVAAITASQTTLVKKFKAVGVYVHAVGRDRFPAAPSPASRSRAAARRAASPSTCSSMRWARRTGSSTRK